MNKHVSTGASQPKRKSFSRGPFGLIIGLSILIFFFYRIGPDNVAQSLTSAKPLYILGTIILVFFWLSLGAANIKIMLRPLNQVGFGNVFHQYSNANMAALVIPGQIGDAVILHFFKSLSIPVSQGATIFAADKLITLFWYSVFTAYGVSLVKLPEDFITLPEVGISSIIIGFVTGIIIISAVLYFFITAMSQRLQNWISLSYGYLKQARHSIITNVFITLFRTFILGCSYWLIITAYGQAPSFIHTLCFSITAGMVAYIPISFNGLGTVEASLIYLFKTVGADSASILSAALTLRVITILVVTGSATISNALIKAE